MKRLVTLFVILLVSLGLFAKKVELSKGEHGYKILSNHQSMLKMEYDLGAIHFKDVTTEKGEFSRIAFEGSKNSVIVGSPELPEFRDLIEMPFNSNPTIKLLSYDIEEYTLKELGINNEIYPAQPSYEKCTAPEDIKFIFNKEIYNRELFIGSEIASIKKIGTSRGIDQAVLEIAPIKYNPTTETFQVYQNIKFELNYNNSDFQKASEKRVREYSPFFAGTEKYNINTKPLNGSEKDSQFRAPVSYLIVANNLLENNIDLERFIDWKTEKGFNVVTNYVASTATVEEIDSWVEEQYENITPAPSFVLLVGDMNGSYTVATDVPSSAPQASDLPYGVIGDIDSDNHVPSIYVGRFSVRSEADLTAQVDKTIWYEKEMFTSGADFSYLENTMGTAGHDTGYQASHGNPHIRYAMEHYFNNNSYTYPNYGTTPTITGYRNIFKIWLSKLSCNYQMCLPNCKWGYINRSITIFISHTSTMKNTIVICKGNICFRCRCNLKCSSTWSNRSHTIYCLDCRNANICRYRRIPKYVICVIIF